MLCRELLTLGDRLQVGTTRLMHIVELNDIITVAPHK